MSSEPLRTVVLISGNGSNLQALIDAARDSLPIDIAAVISNRPDAYGLARADAADIPTRALDPHRFGSRAAFDAALADLIDSFEPQLVLLAGFMRILPDDIVARYAGRMANIHPALLPDFPGLDTHRRALEAGVERHGASVHFVTTEVDGGPVLMQATVPVEPDDTAEALAARVLVQEHRLYPSAVALIASGRARLDGDRILVDGEPLRAPLMLGDDA